MPTLPHISWTSVIEIVLIAVVLYQFLLLVRGTRAAQMLVGVGTLAVLLLVLRRVHLPVVNWIIGNLLPYSLFALIVIFQAEIRHILAKVGRVITFNSPLAESGSYEDVVMAANLFSQQRTGALIVIEREIGLRTYIESGVAMDARLSYDLLITIFRPTASLHDGAVIVQKDRIAAAACFLPLSMNPVLSNEMGTRHRAAIGITEETDAVAIIVSEETGQISLAQAGHVERDISLEQLRDHLGKLLHRYVPVTTLPTPIADSADAESALGKTSEVAKR